MNRSNDVESLCVHVCVLLVSKQTNGIRPLAWLQVSTRTWLQLARWAFSPDTLE